jgi:membrane protease subunit HflK
MSDDESPEGPDGREPRRPRRTILELPQAEGGGFKMPRFGGGMPKLPLRTLGCGALVVAALLALFSMYYQIAPYEQGVVLRFGKHVGNVGPGPHLKLPFGITQVLRVETEKQHKLEFGFRTKEPGQRTVYVKEGFGVESSMLTGDLNIASVEWVVQYRIDDPYKYLFRLRDTAATVAAVAEAEMRGAVGDMGFDEVIKSKRAEIEEQVRRHMREILTAYDSGVDIKLVQLQDVHPPDPVKDSFEDVNRALQEMERSINESLQERNKVLYRVEGEAKQRVAQAEGTKIERINRSQGDAKRFELLLAEYRKAPGVTRRRLYLETMESVIPSVGKVVVVDESIKGALPILGLDGALRLPAKPAEGSQQ